MLDKFNQYRQHFVFPFPKKNSKNSAYKFEWIEDLHGLQEAQRFRATQFSQQFGIHFSKGLDQDLYDFSCQHAVLRDRFSHEIIAYSRVKLLQGHELAHSYSQQEFNVAGIMGHLDNIVEVGRTCVHPRWRNGKALSMLWLNMAPKVLWEMRAKHLIGCVSIRLQDNEARAYCNHQRMKNLTPAQRCMVQPHQAYEPAHPQFSFAQDERMPKLFQIYLNMQGQLSSQAYYDQAFNCLDYFVHLEVNAVAKNLIFQKKLRANA